MAAPVAHIFCALMLLQSGTLKVASEQEFIIGTSFPDIRYLAKLKREDTHKKVTWDDVQNAPTDFEKGMYFHGLVDDVRIQKIEIEGKELIPYVPAMQIYMLKLFEDRLVYNSIDNWQKIISYFDDILPEELAYVSKKQAHEWHQFIQRYCRKKVSASHMQNIIDTTPHFSIKMPKIPRLFNTAYMALVLYRYGNATKLVELLTDFYENIVSHSRAYQPYATHDPASLFA